MLSRMNSEESLLIFNAFSTLKVFNTNLRVFSKTSSEITFYIGNIFLLIFQDDKVIIRPVIDVYILFFYFVAMNSLI